MSEIHDIAGDIAYLFKTVKAPNPAPTRRASVYGISGSPMEPILSTVCKRE